VVLFEEGVALFHGDAELPNAANLFQTQIVFCRFVSPISEGADGRNPPI
jgi:hypothetical protein